MPDELKVNVPLLRKTLEHITEHPEEWDQVVWARKTRCGTACCVAGTAVLIAGHEINWDDHAHAILNPDASRAYRTMTGEWIEEVAKRELGLSAGQAASLFLATNSLETLWDLAGYYSDGEIETPVNGL